MSKHIVLLTGVKGAGKDVCAQYLVEEFNFVRFGYADRIREYLEVLNPIIPICYNEDGTVQACEELGSLLRMQGWDVVKRMYPEVRRLLQVFGTELFRDRVARNYWVDDMVGRIKEAGFPDKIIIPDWRFSNEYFFLRYDYLLEKHGYVFHRGKVIGKESQYDVHSSENQQMEVDFLIPNLGTKKGLYSLLDSMVESF